MHLTLRYFALIYRFHWYSLPPCGGYLYQVSEFKLELYREHPLRTPCICNTDYLYQANCVHEQKEHSLLYAACAKQFKALSSQFFANFN